MVSLAAGQIEQDEELARELRHYLHTIQGNEDQAFWISDQKVEPGNDLEFYPTFDGNLPLIETVRFVRSKIVE